MKRTGVPKETGLLDESNIQRLLNVFFLHPEKEFSLTEVAQQAGIAKSAASRLLPPLAAADIVTVQKLGPVHRIQAKRDSFAFTKRKIAWNITTIYSTSLIEYLDEQFHRPKAIVLFGSYRTGADQSDSDIDIAIETTEEKDVESLRLPELTQLEEQLQRPIQVHVFHRKYIDENVFASIANGIVLRGYLEVHK